MCQLILGSLPKKQVLLTSESSLQVPNIFLKIFTVVANDIISHQLFKWGYLGSCFDFPLALSFLLLSMLLRALILAHASVSPLYSQHTDTTRPFTVSILDCCLHLPSLNSQSCFILLAAGCTRNNLSIACTQLCAALHKILHFHPASSGPIVSPQI